MHNSYSPGVAIMHYMVERITLAFKQSPYCSVLPVNFSKSFNFVTSIAVANTYLCLIEQRSRIMTSSIFNT